MGHDRFRVLLEVVGWKVIVLRRDESLEEAEGAARRELKNAFLLFGKRLSLRGARGQAGLPRDPRRDAPEDEKGDDERRPVSDQERDRAGEGGEADPWRHAPVKAGELEVETALRLGRRDPLEEAPPRNDQPEESSQVPNIVET